MATSEMQNLLAGNEDQIVLYRAGQNAKGIVYDVNPHRILVNLPGGATAIVTKKEATGYGSSTETVSVGEPIEALVISTGVVNSISIFLRTSPLGIFKS